jgi:hypothetical protein
MKDWSEEFQNYIAPLRCHSGGMNWDADMIDCDGYCGKASV